MILENALQMLDATTDELYPCIPDFLANSELPSLCFLAWSKKLLPTAASSGLIAPPTRAATTIGASTSGIGLSHSRLMYHTPVAIELRLIV